MKRLLVLVALVAACQSHDASTTGSSAVATVVLSTTAVTLLPNATAMVSATARTSAGIAVAGLPVTWSSSAPAIATVDNNGLVTAISIGRTTLTATVGGLTAAVTIAVAIPPPPAGPDTTAKLGQWTVVLNRPLSSKYESMAFPDALNGWVVADVGFVLHTPDGGATWSQQATLTGLLRSMDFTDATHGFIGALNGNLYHTTDGGVTWTNVSSTLPKPPIGFCGITHFGSTIHAVGRYINATDYYRSPDAGATWVYTSLAAYAQGLVDVAFVSDSVGFISGMAKSTVPQQGPGTILKTTDGGVTWRTVFVDNGGTEWAWKVFPVNANTIYASLESEDGVYRIAKSIDGGENWTVQIVATGQPLGTSGGLQGIGFLDENVGWVGGFFTGMYATTNGGATWKPVTLSSANVNRYRRVGSTLFTAGTLGVLRYDASH